MAANLTWIIVCLLFARFLSEKCNRIRNGIPEWFCCNNQELQGDICVECKDGFKAKDGFPCEPCPAGAWGRKCIGSCDDCEHDQRCDSVSGCINTFDISTPPYLSTESTSLTLKDKEISDELLPREIIIYASGTIILFVISIVCATCFCYKEKIVKLFRISTQNQMLVEADDNERMPSNDQIESHYISLDDVTEQDLGSSVDNTVDLRLRDDVVLAVNDELSDEERQSVVLPIPLATTSSSDDADDGYLHPVGKSDDRESLTIQNSSTDSSNSDVTSLHDKCHYQYQPAISPIDKEFKHPYQDEVTPLNRDCLHPYQHEVTPLNRDCLHLYQPQVTPQNKDYGHPYQSVGPILDIHVYEQRREIESESSDKCIDSDKRVHVESTTDDELKSNTINVET